MGSSWRASSPCLTFVNNPPTGPTAPGYTFILNTGFLAGPNAFGVAVTCQELSGRAILTFNRMYGTAGTFGMNYHTIDGTAVAGVDYTAVSGSITWAVGDYSPKVIQIPLFQTGKVVNQFFTFSIDAVTGNGRPATGAAIFTGGNLSPRPGPNYTPGPVTFPVTIIRPGNGEADFVGTPYSVARPGGSTTLTLQVQRFNSFRGAVTVNFHTTDGTAVAGVAYTALSGTLSWADGEGGTKNIVITILNGGAGTQSFTVTIDTPTGGIVIGPTNVATVNIVAAGPPPNPSPGGSVPQQLTDELVTASDTMRLQTNITLDELTSYFSRNLLYQGMLGGQIVGGFIGFGGGTGSFNQGTDPTDQQQTLVPFGGRFKFQGFHN